MRNAKDEALAFIYKRHARASEGIKPNVYWDSKRIPTIGVGYAMADKDRRMYSRESVNADLNIASGTKGVEYFTKEDFQKIVTAQKAEDLKGVGPTLSPKQMENLLDLSVQRKFDAADNTLRALKINPETMSEPLRKALIDLSFRGGDNLFGKGSPTLNGALVHGDLAGVIIEIKYGSNGDNERGNDVRNDKLVKEILDSLTPDQQKQVQAEIDRQMKKPRNKHLEEKYHQRQKGGKTKEGHKKEDKDTPSKGSDNSVFVHPYDRRTGHVAEHYRSPPDGDPSNNFAVASRGQSHGQVAGIREPGPNEKKLPGVKYIWRN